MTRATLDRTRRISALSGAMALAGQVVSKRPLATRGVSGEAAAQRYETNVRIRNNAARIVEKDLSLWPWMLMLDSNQ